MRRAAGQPGLASGKARLLVWDLPTRVTHWLIVLCFAVSWWSAKSHLMQWHYRSGMTMFMLLIFRLLWGFIGHTPSRFSHFMNRPSTVLAYARTLHLSVGDDHAGHNPMGGVSVILLLLLLLTQVTLGLFAVDVDGLESGPLSWLVSFDAGRRVANFHGWIFDALVVLISLHIVAVMLYLVVKRFNLISPMIHGYKTLSTEQVLSPLRHMWLKLTLALAASAGLMIAVWNGL